LRRKKTPATNCCEGFRCERTIADP